MPEPRAGAAGTHRAVVALGSNLGARERHLERALAELDALPGTRLVARSTLHETAPVGGPADQPRYLNAAAVVTTELGPRELLRALLAIEARHGRRREEGVRDAPRTLDLDLLVVERGGVELVVDEPELVLPHPRMEERTFVLAPLAELEPARVLASGRTVAERLAELGASAGTEAAGR